LQDKKAGKPWITKLGFPVHVVERIEVYDEPTKSKYVSRYAYHHGYFDRKEREFRGFGMVEQWDTDDFNTQASTPLSQFPNLSEGDTYPIYTKSWFHTGFYKNADIISDLYRQEYFDAEADAWILPDTILPQGLSIQEKREAARTLKGSLLRQEIYSQDGSEKEGIPYTVSENSFKISLKQNLHKNKHAVFMVLPSESINLNYERVLEDPRIVHTLNLEYDEFGNPLKQATVAYQRLTNAVAGQDKTLVSVKQNSFFNSDENTDFHRIGVAYQTKNYEIFDFETNTSKLAIEDFANFANLNKKLIQNQKTLFYDTTCENALNLGSISAHGLVYKSLTLSMTEDLINSHIVAEGRTNLVTASELKTILTNFAYLAENNNTEFWMPSESAKYDISNFYMPIKQIDPMGNETSLLYDTYKLLPIKVTDALLYETHITNDYANMQAVKVVDPNANGIEMKLNGLGMPLKQWLFGSQGEGDTLSSPTIEYEYSLNNWTENSEPIFVHVTAKTEHGTCNDFLHTYEYTSGLGQPILIKTTAEDGLAWQLNPETGIKEEINCGTRFVASGRIVYNNKGDIVKQYEPWFSTNGGYESEDELMEYGVTPIMHYDPAGRLVQTDFPDGTTTKVEFNAWQQKNYDQNDCDSNSSHYNTPQTVLISPLGVAFKTIDDNGSFGTVQTTQKLDILGQVIEVEDALQRKMTENVYDMSGQLIMTNNIDSGKRWLIYNSAKLPVYAWDSRDQLTKSEYDVLLRPTNTLLKAGTATEIKVQKIEYGTNANLNNIGQIENIYAQDGKTSFEYDFKGNITKQNKQFAQDYQNKLDWNGTVALNNEIFATQTTYDALNRPVTVTQPDNTIITNVYNKGGLLEKVKQGSTEYISNIDYNARGQRTKIVYGNGSETTFTYDEENFRLTRLLTTRSTGNDILQDLNYSYDSVGNITQVEDDAQQTIYFNNTVIEPISTFEYDALYRLTKATGRELASLQLPINTDFVNNIPVPNTGSNAMQTYTQQYSYDKLGNILQMRSVNHWTRNYYYDTATNRLLKHEEHGQNEYTYDAHGNMLTMPHLTNMVWDYKDELISASNGTVNSFYNYDAEGNRTRKVVVKPGGIIEERYYLDGYEVYRKYLNNNLDLERKTINVYDVKLFDKNNDDKEDKGYSIDKNKKFAIVDIKTVENGTTLPNPNTIIRYQYDNHLGSACLELDNTAAIISYEEYHPFGTTSYRSGRNEVDVSLKRYKYIGKERDEETGLYYFGARYYAGWMGRWISVDPLKEKYLNLTPYNYCANNPIYFVDPSGESGVAYKTQQINEKTGRPIMKVVSNMYIYGQDANETTRAAIQNQSDAQWNNGGNYFTYTDDSGTTYDVVFEFKTEIIDAKDVDAKMIEGDYYNLNAENNFYEIRDDVSESLCLSGNVEGGNAGVIKTSDIWKQSVAHEENHGFNGINKDKSKVREDNNPDISVTQANTSDPSIRKVTQENITAIFNNVKFDKNGKGNVGHARPFKWDKDAPANIVQIPKN
jgi:RHS repeat-associated protein